MACTSPLFLFLYRTLGGPLKWRAPTQLLIGQVYFHKSKEEQGLPPPHSFESEEMLKKLVVQGNRMDMEECSRAH